MSLDRPQAQWQHVTLWSCVVYCSLFRRIVCMTLYIPQPQWQHVTLWHKHMWFSLFRIYTDLVLLIAVSFVGLCLWVFIYLSHSCNTSPSYTNMRMSLCSIYTQVFRRLLHPLIYVCVYDSLCTTAAAVTRHPPTRRVCSVQSPATLRCVKRDIFTWK